MSKKSTFKNISGQQLGLLFLAMVVANSVIIYLGSIFFPTRVVLGTFFITPLWAIIHATVTFAIINAGIVPAVECWMEKYGFLEFKQRAVIYLLLNFIGLWIISRFSYQLGLGLASWFIILFISLLSTIAQKFSLKSILKLK